jgi:hypothetical protein
MIGRVRLFVVLACVAGCSFRHGVVEDRDAATVADVAIDAEPDAAPPAFCPTDSHLRLCYSFDQDPLPETLANEGAAQVSATLTGVTRTVGRSGGAALLDAASIIHVPTSAQVTNIQAIEVWYRADADPANGGRFGLVDSNVIPPNISLFVGRVDPTHQLRCGIGAGSGVADATLALGTWYHVACVCDAGSLKLYVDGVKIGEPAASCASGGEVVSAGLTIGSNNNGGPTGVNDWLVGAVDGVRLWDVTLTEQTVAAHARQLVTPAAR